jgi:hypothetical protein
LRQPNHWSEPNISQIEAWKQAIYAQEFDLIWFDLIWFDLIWFDLIWFDLIWFDLILIFFK